MAKAKKTNCIPSNQKYTVQDFNIEFPDDDACLMFVLESRWPDGRTLCEKCGMERKHYRVTGRTAFACDHCGNHIYPMAGTIFEKSSTSLKTWFYAMYLMVPRAAESPQSRFSARLASPTKPRGACLSRFEP